METLQTGTEFVIDGEKARVEIIFPIYDGAVVRSTGAVEKVQGQPVAVVRIQAADRRVRRQNMTVADVQAIIDATAAKVARAKESLAAGRSAHQAKIIRLMGEGWTLREGCTIGHGTDLSKGKERFTVSTVTLLALRAAGVIEEATKPDPLGANVRTYRLPQAEKKVVVRVGAVLYQAMQLDAIGADYGLTIESKGNQIQITASRADMERFRRAVNADTWNADQRFSNAAKRALPRIDAALAAV